MLDLVLNVFVIVAPFVLSAVFIIIPSKTEKPRAYRRWCIGLLIFGIAFSILSSWQQRRLSVEAENDKHESVDRAKQSQQAIIDDQKTRIDALQQDVDRQGSAALISAKDQFKTTLDSMNKVVSITRSTADLSAKNLAAISGKDSYPCLNPGVVKDGIAILQVTNLGPNPLTGVQLKIYPFKKDNKLPDNFFFMPLRDVGTIAGNHGKLVSGGLQLRPQDQDTDGVYRYNVEITAQNGVYNEALSLRRSNDINGWTAEYSEGAFQWKGVTKDPNAPVQFVFARCKQPPYPPNEQLPARFEMVP
jgi:hypothetical protein